jgi:glutaredoxin
VRCHLASRALARALKDYPDIAVEKIEYFTNMSAAKAAGVRSFPTLVSGGQQLSGILLTEKNIREFLKGI